jgi:hypothetical protein
MSIVTLDTAVISVGCTGCVGYLFLIRLVVLSLQKEEARMHQ